MGDFACCDVLRGSVLKGLLLGLAVVLVSREKEIL